MPINLTRAPVESMIPTDVTKDDKLVYGTFRIPNYNSSKSESNNTQNGVKFIETSNTGMRENIRFLSDLFIKRLV